jgi:hypothetical protein
LYWLVGHYEGICIAAELRDQGKPVHLTVHDDPFGTWRRSDRYRWFQPLLRATYPQLLRRARSIDVTSWGMRNLYRKNYGANCFSVYLHVPALPQLSLAPDPSKLTIGHIGTLYSLTPFRRFLNACKQIAAEQNRRLRVLRIGSSPELNDLADENPEIFESHGDLSEDAAVPLLAACDLLYAMYPGRRQVRTISPHQSADQTFHICSGAAPYFYATRRQTADWRGSSTPRGLAVFAQRRGKRNRPENQQHHPRHNSGESFESLRQELMGPEQVRPTRRCAARRTLAEVSGEQFPVVKARVVGRAWKLARSAFAC